MDHPSMHTIVLATEKGGSGKSTLAIGLALAAQQAGYNVRLIEAGPHATLSNWRSRRKDADPTVETIRNAHEIKPRLQALADSGVRLAVIDTAGGMITAAAIRYSDLCLIPARPSVADIEATAFTLSVVRACKKPFAFVLDQTPIRGRRINTAADALAIDSAADLVDVLAQPFIAMRNDHQDALAAGLGVVEYAPASKAAEEICALWRWVEAKVGASATTIEDELARDIALSPVTAAFLPPLAESTAFVF